MKTNVVVDVPAPVFNITLPSDTPLLCDVKTAEKILGMSRSTLQELRNKYSDFPTVKVGRSVLYDIPRIYAWQAAMGGEIPLD